MDKFFLFKRENAEEVGYDPINGDNFYTAERQPDGYILDKIVDTEEDVVNVDENCILYSI